MSRIDGAYGDRNLVCSCPPLSAYEDDVAQWQFRQPGIFAQGTRSHYHLEFDLRPGATDEAIRAAVARPARAAGHRRRVEHRRRLRHRALATPAPDDVPADSGPFETIEGAGHTAPATQHDIWVWTHGTGEDVELDIARGIVAAFAPVATLALEQPCFVYQDSRDLTGFIDGTENPPVEEAHDVAIIPDGQPGEGGAHVIAQKWVHDLDAFHAQDVEDQEGTIGRTKPDSVELDDKPADRAHRPRRDRGRRRGARDLPPQRARTAVCRSTASTSSRSAPSAAASPRCCTACSA